MIDPVNIADHFMTLYQIYTTYHFKRGKSILTKSIAEYSMYKRVCVCVYIYVCVRVCVCMCIDTMEYATTNDVTTNSFYQ
jgi:hypothetical protein